MRQAVNYWFGENATYMFLFAQTDNGKTCRVRTEKRDNELPEHTEHRLIIRMQKLYKLTTAY